MHSLGSSYLASMALAAAIVGEDKTATYGHICSLDSLWPGLFVVGAYRVCFKAACGRDTPLLTGSDVPAVTSSRGSRWICHKCQRRVRHGAKATSIRPCASSHRPARLVCSAYGVYCPRFVVLSAPALNSSLVLPQYADLVSGRGTGRSDGRWCCVQWRSDLRGVSCPVGKRRKNGPLQ